VLYSVSSGFRRSVTRTNLWHTCTIRPAPPKRPATDRPPGFLDRSTRIDTPTSPRARDSFSATISCGVTRNGKYTERPQRTREQFDTAVLNRACRIPAPERSASSRPRIVRLCLEYTNPSLLNRPHPRRLGKRTPQGCVGGLNASAGNGRSVRKQIMPTGRLSGM
jgi:hypothetical protein